MATIIRNSEWDFRENPGKIDGYRLFSDVTKTRKGIQSKNLNFDLRQLNPGQFSAPYHFHRNAEELFLILSGAMTLRTPEGFENVGSGDLIFFEMGASGAHQFYNQSDEPCIYLDIRTFTGYDICEYPDSDKILLAPSLEVFSKSGKAGYFDGEENPYKIWEELKTTKE